MGRLYPRIELCSDDQERSRRLPLHVGLRSPQRPRPTLLGCDFAWRQFYPSHARIVQIDIDPTHLGRRHPVEIGVVGDVKATLDALIPRLALRRDTRFLDDCAKRHESAFRVLDKRAAAGRGRAIPPQYLAHLIDRYAADDAVFTADGGSPMVWLLRHVRATGRRRYWPDV